MRITRIESRSIVNDVWLKGALVACTCQDARDSMPSPRADGILTIDAAKVFGFRDAASIDRYFSAIDKAELAWHDFVIREYYCPLAHVTLGREQVMFDPRKAKRISERTF